MPQSYEIYNKFYNNTAYRNLSWAIAYASDWPQDEVVAFMILVQNAALERCGAKNMIGSTLRLMMLTNAIGRILSMDTLLYLLDNFLCLFPKGANDVQ